MLIAGANMEKTPEECILDILKEAKESLTVSKTAELAKINRVTAAAICKIPSNFIILKLIMRYLKTCPDRKY